MSTIVSIHTNAELSPDSIFTAVAARDEQIVVTENEWPHLVFGRKHRALRGVEVIKTNEGYDIRVCSFSSPDDYGLFAVTVDTLMSLTSGDAYLEDDPAQPVTDPLSEFDEDWMDDQCVMSMAAAKAIVGHTGHPIIFQGFYAPVCLGPESISTYSQVPFDEIDPQDTSAYKEMASGLESMQEALADLKSTATRMVITDPSDSEHSLSISAIYVKDGEAADFSFVSYADIFSIFDLDQRDKEDPILIPFKYFHHIASGEFFDFVDDYQAVLSQPLEYLEIQQMKAFARRFVPDDLFSKPVYPGQGIGTSGRTFILRWNPTISNVKPEGIHDWMEDILTEVFNWSVWDYDKARMGDKFYLLRVGDHKAGIVASGVFASQPYLASDWSRKGREVRYMNLDANFIADPDGNAVFPMVELQRLLPGFEWGGGHSGVLLPESDSHALEMIWADWLQKCADAPDTECAILDR